MRTDQIDSISRAIIACPSLGHGGLRGPRTELPKSHILCLVCAASGRTHGQPNFHPCKPSLPRTRGLPNTFLKPLGGVRPVRRLSLARRPPPIVRNDREKGQHMRPTPLR